MKDRYLSRAKRIDNEEWVQGSLFERGLSTYIALSVLVNPIIGCETNVIVVEVDEDTICQRTGYKGIYEHDIFRCNDDVYEVTWSNKSLGWEAMSIYSCASISLGEFRPNEIDVIGNSIDNPELLESED